MKDVTLQLHRAIGALQQLMRNLYQYTMCNRMLYNSASPAVSVLVLSQDLSLMMLASALIPLAQSVIMAFQAMSMLWERWCGLDGIQEGFAES